MSSIKKLEAELLAHAEEYYACEPEVAPLDYQDWQRKFDRIRGDIERLKYAETLKPRTMTTVPSGIY